MTTLFLQKKALLDARRVGQNIDETIDTLQACLRVLDMASKVQNLIQNAKYFSALRVSVLAQLGSRSRLTIPFHAWQQLEDLQATHLKPVLHYPFATLMISSVPDLRNSIRDAVTRSLKAWMYEARETSRSVGKGALDAMEQRGRRWAARKRKDASLGLAKINGPIELGLSERHECEFTSPPPSDITY